MKQSNYLEGTLLYAMSLLFLIPLSAYAQNYQLKGYVLDSNDEPLIGANVVVTGTTNGRITDLNGEFVLVVSPNDRIDVSYMGYIKQTIKWKENA